MLVKKDPQELCERLMELELAIDWIIEDYMKEYADYGWDSFAETMANVAGIIHKEKIELCNAELKPEMF